MNSNILIFPDEKGDIKTVIDITKCSSIRFNKDSAYFSMQGQSWGVKASPQVKKEIIEAFEIYNVKRCPIEQLPRSINYENES